MKHNCGKCKAGFDTDTEYCDHTCKVTGVTPKDIEHQGPEFLAISESALKRGSERVAKKPTKKAK
jgi:hypothetical protein